MQPADAYPSNTRPSRLAPHPTLARRGLLRLRVPADIVLTPTVLIGAARRLSDANLEAVIDALIAETDARAGDADREPDVDFEPDEDL